VKIGLWAKLSEDDADDFAYDPSLFLIERSIGVVEEDLRQPYRASATESRETGGGMKYFDLGRHTRPVSTRSVKAQRWFDFGLNWCYGFNHEEGVKCFRKALEADSKCVMAHWGIAYGLGPFYNLAWRELGEREAAAAIALAWDHLGRARALAEHASRLENRLVEALASRFQKPHPVSPKEYDRWDDDYAAAMRRVHYDHPDDDDVMALFAEALITRTPRRLWDVKTGLPARGSDVVEAIAVCERSIALAYASGRPQHPAIAHMLIHALEMSNEPQRAIVAADTLATLCPDAGHMNHMPAHIYVLCGEYEKAQIASDKAIAADDAYADYAASPVNFYVTARCHDIHLWMFACMFLGQYRPALAAAEKLQRIITREVLTVRDRPKLATMTEGYYNMRMHVLVRFGRWREIIAEPLPADPPLFLTSTALQHYARGVAHASLKHIAEAERERGLFHKSLKRIPPDRRFLSNSVVAMLAVGDKMLDGELEYHRGNHDIAFEHLREAVRRDDNLSYTEPWAWMHPPRHALGALLLEQGHVAEAEEVYRDDLGLSGRVQRCTQHPDNVWALHGLVECLERRGERRELRGLRLKLSDVLAKADIPITSSCMCRSNIAELNETCCGVAQPASCAPKTGDALARRLARIFSC
jgi:tetratricopeptide (TPR) repeat protein